MINRTEPFLMFYRLFKQVSVHVQMCVSATSGTTPVKLILTPVLRHCWLHFTPGHENQEVCDTAQ